MCHTLLGFALGVAVLLSAFPSQAAEQKARSTGQVPKEVRDLKGTYTGSWTLFGLDDKGEVVKRMAWTDTIKGDNPQAQGDRAYVTTLAELTFEGGGIPPIKVEGKDGYFLKPDGSVGDPYIETAGKLQRGIKAADNVWVFSSPADMAELARLGFQNVISGQHVMAKVLTHEDGAETHRITRVTTVNWKDREGKTRWLQYVSLQGFHKRQP